MKKTMVSLMLTLTLFSSIAFAEGGADTLFERNKSRLHEAIEAQQKSQGDDQNTAKSENEKNTKSSS